MPVMSWNTVQLFQLGRLNAFEWLIIEPFAGDVI
jgi:hypothetical protein